MHVSSSVDLATLQAQLQSDQQKLTADREGRDSALKADRDACTSDKLAIEAAKKNAKVQLDSDTLAMNAALLADRNAGQPVRNEWLPLLQADLAVLKGAVPNSDAFVNAKTKLDADSSSFRTAMAPFETQTKADIAKWTQQLKTDKAAVESAGSNLTEQYKSDCQKLKTDGWVFAKLVSVDEKTVKNDLELIKKALKGIGDHSGSNDSKKPETHSK